MGLRRGRLEAGRWADFVVVDLKRRQPIATDWLVTKTRWTPYEGQPACVPRHHILHGKVAVEDGTRAISRGAGRRVRISGRP
jgi:dihydroorotase